MLLSAIFNLRPVLEAVLRFFLPRLAQFEKGPVTRRVGAPLPDTRVTASR